MKAVPKIMLVEDDENLGFLLKDSMEACGWEVALLRDGERGLTAFHNQDFDLCILDIMLPEKDGFQLASDIRKYNQRIPIVFLTAKSQVDDRIKGFQIGADDYVCKPFSIEELKCRIDAILKRSAGDIRTAGHSALLKVGNTTLDIHNLIVETSGVKTQLTYKEGKLLQMFFRHADRLVEREVFLKAVWEDNGFFVARSMDVFVSKLRRHLRHDPSIRIENIRGVGYVLKVKK
jgi:DNA-binding response OmpR family regulator